MAELISKLGKIFGTEEDPSKIIKVSLKPPVVLLLQMIETVMASISNIQQSFQSSNVDYNPYYLLKQYLPSIDWDEFSKEAREFQLFQKAQSKGVDDPMGGGGFG